MNEKRSMEQDGDQILTNDSDSDSTDKSVKNKWTPEEDENLKILVTNFGKKDWKTISSFLPGRTEPQCMSRWKKSLDPDLVKGYWTPEEDQQIIDLVALYGTKCWTLIAKHLNGRLGKQCRERWHNHLDPLVNKSSWTKEEDLILYKAHSVMGNRWADIARLLPGRTDNSVKNHYNSTIKRLAERGLFRKEAESIQLDIQQFGEGEEEFKCDVVLDTEPVAPKVINVEKETKPVEPQKTNPKPQVPPAQTVTQRKELTSGSSSVTNRSGSRPISSSGTAKASAAVDQKKLVDAALRMIAEDMLPLSFVEGAGFKSFMAAICPEYNRLTQRVVGLQLYDDVERTIKPQLIRDLKACLALNKDGDGVIHVTVDLWAGARSAPADEPFVIVQLHFISEFWQIRRPIVAFRHLSHKDLSAAVSRELEGVLLSYGIFPHRIGYVLTNNAKEAVSANRLFCDYKVMLNRAEAEGEEMLSFLSDQISETDSPFSELQMGTRASCVATTLQLVIREALKNSRVVENLLSQAHNVVSFFRSSPYWSEVLMKECGALLWPPSSNCRWNSMLVSLRKMTQESVWSSVMTVLTQARIEASDSASAPPLVMVKREQVVDILGLLEPFEEALQTLQGNSVSISYVIPSLVRLDKTLVSRETNYTHFSKALRTGLHARFQSVIQQKDLIMATVLDPRIKMQPFGESAVEETDFISPPSKSEVFNIIEAALNPVESPSPGSVEKNKDTTSNELSVKGESQETQIKEPSSEKLDHNLNKNDLKRKSPRSLLPQPPAKSVKLSELDVYLSEQTQDISSCVVFWKTAYRFPQLQSLARMLLAVPPTSGGFDRLYPMSTCIIRARRNRLPSHTTERLLLYKNSLKTSNVKKPSKGKKQ